MQFYSVTLRCGEDSLLFQSVLKQIDVVDDVYVAAVGHLREDQGLGPAALVKNILDCSREMLEVRSLKRECQYLFFSA
jgi:hypothetical protein